MAQRRQYDETLGADTFQDPNIYQPNPIAPQVPSPPRSMDNGDLFAQAQQRYVGNGGQWDADAQQQFQHRLDVGQSPEEILQHATEDARARFPGAATAQPRQQQAQMPSFGSGQQGGSGMDINSVLQGFLTGGRNQDVLNSRVNAARDDMNRTRKSQLATDRAMLANRGTLGSGPEITAMNRMEEGLADQYGSKLASIYGDESAAADQRLLGALGIGANLQSADLDRAIQQFRADTERNLGLGNLALGNTSLANNYNLGLANFGLERDKYLNDSSNNDVEQLIQLIQELQKAGLISAGGFV